MSNNQETHEPYHDYVPTSHYHLPMRYVLIVVCVALCGLLLLFLLFAAIRATVDTEQFIVPLSPAVVEAPPALLPRSYNGSAVSFIYPPEYEMSDKEESERLPGSLAEYVFIGPGTGNKQQPFLIDLTLYTGDSIQTARLDRSAFDTEKVSFEQGLDVEGRQTSFFNDLKYYVYNTEEGVIAIRHYITFIDGTRIEIRIAMPSASFSMQADELFRLVHVVSRIEEQDKTMLEQEFSDEADVSMGVE